AVMGEGVLPTLKKVAQLTLEKINRTFEEKPGEIVRANAKHETRRPRAPEEPRREKPRERPTPAPATPVRTAPVVPPPKPAAIIEPAPVNKPASTRRTPLTDAGERIRVEAAQVKPVPATSGARW